MADLIVKSSTLIFILVLSIYAVGQIDAVDAEKAKPKKSKVQQKADARKKAQQLGSTSNQFSREDWKYQNTKTYQTPKSSSSISTKNDIVIIKEISPQKTINTKQSTQRESDLERELQRLTNQQDLENAKTQMRLLGNSLPLIKGLINGKLTFYVLPLPGYASQDVRNHVENLASWMDGKIIHGVRLERVYSQNADLTINWVKDYQEETIGRQVGSYLIVGLGTSNNCYGEWRPFTGYTVYKIMWHELGHALGHDHTPDTNNIMYKNTDTKYEYEYNLQNFVLGDGYWRAIPLCHGHGSFYFTTETTSTNAGYKVYVIPPNSNVNDVLNGNGLAYTSCSAYKDEMISFTQSCNAENGSTLVVYNPSALGMGSDIRMNVKVYDRSNDVEPDFEFPDSSLYFSQQQLEAVWNLFH